MTRKGDRCRNWLISELRRISTVEKRLGQAQMMTLGSPGRSGRTSSDLLPTDEVNWRIWLSRAANDAAGNVLRQVCVALMVGMRCSLSHRLKLQFQAKGVPSPQI